jgi:hypothetical protein
MPRHTFAAIASLLSGAGLITIAAWDPLHSGGNQFTVLFCLIGAACMLAGSWLLAPRITWALLELVVEFFSL